MKSILSIAVATIIVGVVPVLAQAQDAAKPCTKEMRPAGELSDWNDPASLKAAASADLLPSAVLPVGQTARLALWPSADVHYPVRPGKPSGAGSFGGVVQLTVSTTGAASTIALVTSQY